MLTRPIFIRPDSEFIRESSCACARLLVDEENIGCAIIEWWKNENIDEFYTKTTQRLGFLNYINSNEFTCNMLTSSSIVSIYSSYHTLLGKRRKCSQFIINQVLMAILPTDDAKHSNSFQLLRYYNRFSKPSFLFRTIY